MPPDYIQMRLARYQRDEHDNYMERYKPLLTSIKHSHANMHVTGVLPYLNRNKYKMSKLIYVNNYLSVFCKAKQILFSDLWETMIDLKYYDCNGFTISRHAETRVAKLPLKAFFRTLELNS